MAIGLLTRPAAWLRSHLTFGRALPRAGWDELDDISQGVFDKLDVDELAEMVRSGEVRHQALLTMATAADARAAQMLSGSAALSAATGAVAVALFGTTGGGIATGSAMVGLACGGVLFGVAAGLAAYAARPENKYRPPGQPPSVFWRDHILSGGKRLMLLYTVGELQKDIAVITDRGIKRGRWTTASLWCLAGAFPVSVLAGLVRWISG